MTELDRETQAAIDALVHRLRNREPGTDDEPFAMEFVQALIGRGWRPTNAHRPSVWQRPASDAKTPAWHERAAEARERLLNRPGPKDAA